ncbi:DUF6980 family protein [Caenimonas koreensis]|uniref:DUF6980 family protein n=1 Tax=Caenimonas koreensis TaxID=367474 RepID=UPI00378316B7
MTSPNHCCAGMAAAIADPNVPVLFVLKFREYGTQLLDGGTRFKQLQFCPWCGTQLPTSLRDKWFDDLERAGIDPTEIESIPDKYSDQRWYSES